MLIAERGRMGAPASLRRGHGMIINSQALDLVYKGFKATYTDAFLAAPGFADDVAMTVPSSAAEETYSWLGSFPHVREWIGPRHVQNLTTSTFTIKNRKFESTVAVPRTSIADDRLGVFKPVFAEMGQLARRHREELVFGLLKAGFDTACYDGQNFFDTDHPVTGADGAVTTVSNSGGGAGSAWYLLDVSRGVRPILYQEREAPEFTAMTEPGNEHVFKTDEYIYGVRARSNAGFGLWQLAYGSKQTLNATNYAAARAAMMSFRADGGRPLGIAPDVLVVPPALEEAGRRLLNAMTEDGAASNPWAGSARLIVTPYVL
jgi:phage major head subunit gpT-like protein